MNLRKRDATMPATAPRDRSLHFVLHRWTCTCPHFEHRASKIELVSTREAREARVCKHIHGVQDDLDKIPVEKRRNGYKPLHQIPAIHSSVDTTWEVAPADSEKRKYPCHDYVIKRIKLKPLDGELVDLVDYYKAKDHVHFEGMWIPYERFEKLTSPP